jgi:hypothetical protein
MIFSAKRRRRHLRVVHPLPVRLCPPEDPFFGIVLAVIMVAAAIGGMFRLFQIGRP